MLAVLLKLATSRNAVIAGGILAMLVAAAMLIHNHTRNAIDAHDREGAAQIEERSNAATDNRNRLRHDPDSVQQTDGRCRDCR